MLEETQDTAAGWALPRDGRIGIMLESSSCRSVSFLAILASTCYGSPLQREKPDAMQRKTTPTWKQTT